MPASGHAGIPIIVAVFRHVAPSITAIVVAAVPAFVGIHPVLIAPAAVVTLVIITIGVIGILDGSSQRGFTIFRKRFQLLLGAVEKNEIPAWVLLEFVKRYKEFWIFAISTLYV